MMLAGECVHKFCEERERTSSSLTPRHTGHAVTKVLLNVWTPFHSNGNSVTHQLSSLISSSGPFLRKPRDLWA